MRTHSYAELFQVVAMPHSVVNRRAKLNRVILDAHVEVPAGLVVGEDPEEDAKWFRVSEGGVTLITRPMIERWRAAKE